ncbi:MAG: DUF4304 domain-containing protein [Lachnospiraceae bacterium]|nr:DUF4304 domain-containing protein [Lachnospiraceae bacterium]
MKPNNAMLRGMELRVMDNTEFKKIVQETTSKYGFKYFKKNYYYELDNVIIVINLQKSNYDNSYYINYGFCVKDIHDNLQYPKCYECDITSRFVDTENKGEYQLDTLNPVELVMNLEKNINSFIVPVINEGIKKFFELFPQYSCMATLSLKKYLGID